MEPIITFKEIILVYIDGQEVGRILETAGGFVYIAKSEKNGYGFVHAGETYPTLEECKQSLMG